MAYTTLADLFKGICDAIRSKNGTSALINHQDIPSKILSIQTYGAQIYRGTFTTDSNSEVNVDLGFKPDLITVLLGVYKDPGFPDIESNLTVDCKNATTDGTLLASSGYLIDGSGTLEFDAIPNDTGFYARMYENKWVGGVVNVPNKTYQFIATKYTNI